MTKKEAISIFQRAGWTFTGYKETGWGEKRYHFTHPNIRGEDCYDLSLLRKRARTLDIKMWCEQHRAELRKGIQEELFSNSEIEIHYAITNAGDFQ